MLIYQAIVELNIQRLSLKAVLGFETPNLYVMRTTGSRE